MWVVLCCALASSGCNRWRLPRLDPTGEHLIVPADAPNPSFPPGATPAAPPVGPNTGITVSPSAIIAPVGSEVVMIASVIGGEGFLLTNEVVEWTIEPNSVGQFLSPGERRALDLINWWRGLPVKIDSRFVANATLRFPITLNRGTPSPYDDIFVQTGQSWVTVTSPVQGTSLITAFAPRVPDWNARQQSATIHWIDAQWRFPPPAISETGGRNTLVTTLVRQTNGAPLAGWPVRYEIVSGPDAGFSPDGATSVDIITNELGQAAAEIYQREPAAGTNQINISIIQPAGTAGQTQQLTVGAGSVLQTWGSAGAPAPTIAPQAPPATPIPTTPQPLEPTPATPSAAAKLDVVINGPTEGSVGDDVQFQIDVTNRGTSAATGLVVTSRFDPGLEHAAASGAVARDLVDLQPGGTAQLTMNLRISQAGQLCQHVEVTGNDGLRAIASHCLTATTPPIEQPAPGEERWEPEPSGVQPTPVVPPTEQPSAAPKAATGSALSVRKTGPSRRHVGETALFSIEVTNGSDKPVEDVVIADNFETMLEPVRATEGNEWLEGNALGWRVGTLEAGKTIRRDIELRCLQETPRACNRVTVTARGMVPLAEEACLEIVAAEATPGAASPAAQARQPLRVSVAETTDPVRVGGKTTYQILVENPDSQSYFDVVVSATLSPEVKLETISSPVGTEGALLPGSVRFIPVREVRSGEAALSFELHATGAKPGAATVKVEVTSRGQTQPISAEQKTQVVP